MTFEEKPTKSDIKGRFRQGFSHISPFKKEK